ncbi:MAG: tetratricopeptide repeat protein [Acidobacteriia bacterium]|nr:tetratricopeptide repeat protein [Terriglobia bacterium]
MKLVPIGLIALVHGLAADCPSPPANPEEALARFHELDKKAQVEFRRGEFAKAAENFQQGACVAPEDLRSYYELFGTAIGAAAAGKFDQARHVLQKADALRPDYPLPLAMLVKVNLTSRDADQVKDSLRTAAQRFPLDGRLHAEFVKDLLHQQLPDLALAEALRFEQSGDRDPEATITLAVLENNVGAFGDAVRHALAIEERSELHNDVRASGATIAGLAYENLVRLAEAVQHLKRATEFAPAREDPYLALARIYDKQQNAKAAVEILEQGRKQIPNSPKLSLALGSSLVSAGQYPAAVKVLAELVQRAPDELDAYPKLAEAHREMGEASQATATLRQLAQRKADYPMLHIAIAQSMLAADPADYPGVLGELAQAEKVSPTDYDVYYLRGKVYLAMSKYREAIAAFRYAVALRPAEPGAYYQLGLAYRKSGQPALATEQFQRVEYLKSQPARP